MGVEEERGEVGAAAATKFVKALLGRVCSAFASDGGEATMIGSAIAALGEMASVVLS